MPRPALTALTLAQFRSHRVTRLQLDGRPVAIFGSNGAGKTNMLEAVSLLSPGRGLRRAAASDLARRPDLVGWRVDALVDTPGGSHEIETGAEPGAARRVLIDGKPAPQLRLGHLLNVLWLVPAMDRLWIEAADGRRRFLDRMTLGFAPGHGEASLRYDRAMRERNRLLRDGGSAGWFDALEAQMAEHGVEVAANRRLALSRIADAAQESPTRFPTPELSIDDSSPATAEALAAALAENRRRDEAAGRTLVGPHRADLRAIYAEKAVDARDCSTGEQKALLIALVLANTRALARQTGTAPILLLDEVAAHLDEHRRSALYDEIAALRAQAWMTATERSLFEALGDEAQVLEVSERDGVSHISEP